MSARHLLALALAAGTLALGAPVLAPSSAEAATVCRTDRVCRVDYRWVTKRGPRVCDTVTYNGYVVGRDCVRQGSAWRVRMPVETCRRERVCTRY
jgi:hypothetical protein